MQSPAGGVGERLFSHIPNRLKPKLRLRPIQKISERFSAVDDVGLHYQGKLQAHPNQAHLQRALQKDYFLFPREDNEHCSILERSGSGRATLRTLADKLGAAFSSMRHPQEFGFRSKQNFSGSA